MVADDVALRGVAVASGAVAARRLPLLREMVDVAMRGDAALGSPDAADDGIWKVVFLPRYGREFLDLLAEPALVEPCDRILEPGSISYTMTSLCHRPRGTGKAVHVDNSYGSKEFTVGVGVMALLDEYTEDVGPPRFYPELTDEPPEPAAFGRRAMRLEAPAGSASWFNGHLCTTCSRTAPTGGDARS